MRIEIKMLPGISRLIDLDSSIQTGENDSMATLTENRITLIQHAFGKLLTANKKQ
jgi:hypothetical protein